MSQRSIIRQLRKQGVEVGPDPAYEGLEVRGGPGHDNEVCHLIAQLADVVAIRFCSAEFDDDGFQELGRLPGVRRLEINSRKLTAKSVTTLERFVQLREVELGPEIAGDILASSYGKLPHLQFVRISNRGLTSSGLEFASQCPELQYLDVSCNPLSGGFEVLAHCPWLWKLDLSNCRTLDPGEIAHIARLPVTDLRIGGCGVDDAMMGRIAGMPRLASLFIPRSPLTAAADLLLPRIVNLNELMWPAEAIDYSNLAPFGQCQKLKDLMFWMRPEIPKSVLRQVQQLLPACRVSQL